MSAYKYERYAERFLDEIHKTMVDSEIKSIKGKTYLQTLKLYKQGKTVSQIANHRDLGRSTVMTHMAMLVENEEQIDILKIIDLEDLEKISEVWMDEGKPSDLKGVYSKLDQVYDYAQLKLAVAWAKQ